MRIRHFILVSWVIAVASLFEGCTCCAYLNHIFNADRNYEDATKLEEARADSLPGDSDLVATGEAARKYDKVIEKGSRVLERFPDNDRQTARAVFLIGESFRHLISHVCSTIANTNDAVGLEPIIRNSLSQFPAMCLKINAI